LALEQYFSHPRFTYFSHPSISHKQEHEIIKKSEPILITRGVSLRGLAIYIKKYLKAKEELWKLKYFTIAKI
jgi:DUF2075 family protein